MSCFKNALIFGDQNFSSGDHFTKESRQKATSEKLELEALIDMSRQLIEYNHREPGQTVCLHISIFVYISIFIANV